MEQNESPRGTRRWCIPPAIMRDEGEVLEGSPVLREVEGPLAVALWQALRDVMLWASLPPGERAGLFVPAPAPAAPPRVGGPGGDSPLGGALAVLAALARDSAGAEPGRVAAACDRIARWAAGRGAAGTALAFAQAAAVAAPDPAPAAVEMGRLALRLGRYARAETWLRRAVALARRAGDWPSYTQAYVELGTLYGRRGETERARRLFTRAKRAGRRHGVREARGRALHGLMRLAIAAGELERAEPLGRAALRALRREHADAPEVTFDMARLWVARGEHERALPVLRRLLVSRSEPGERMRTQALLARAAAGAGARHALEDAWTGVWSLVERHGDDPAALDAVLELARAAASVPDWARVGQATRRALELAQRRGGAALAAEVAAVVAELRPRYGNGAAGAA